MVDLLTEIMKFINQLIDFLSENLSINKEKKFIYIEEEGKAVECIDFLKDVEIYDKSVIPYNLLNEYTIKQEDLICKRTIQSKAAKNKVTNFEFTLVSSKWNDFNESSAFCYDLGSNYNNKISPRLKSHNGFAKRLFFPLNIVVDKGHDIKVQLNYINYGCLCDKRCYIVADAKYKKLDLKEYIVKITFEEIHPKDIRVYEIDNVKRVYCYVCRLLPQEFITCDNSNQTIFEHKINITQINNKISLVYFFDK